MKSIMKNIVNTNDERVSFARSIDFAELFEYVKRFTGATCLFEQPEITENNGNVCINFKSDDLSMQTGPFAAILKSCYFSSFSNGVNQMETGDLRYHVSVRLMYEHKDGGKNGMEVVWATYTDREGWLFWDDGK